MNFNILTQQIKVVQDAIQASTAHAINISLTARNWLFGYYITEFEQRGDDRAAYGEKLLANLEIKLNRKGLTEIRFREFRHFIRFIHNWDLSLSRHYQTKSFIV